MDNRLKKDIIFKWQTYFPGQEMPVAVFYSGDLNGAEYVKKPADNERGYTCVFAQMAKVHLGEPVAFDFDNLGCWGARENIFGGPYVEDATVKLLVEIEKFKKDRQQVNALHDITPCVEPTGRYLIIKPLATLKDDDQPEIFCIFAKPDVIAALHSLIGFDNTRPDNMIAPFGSGCEQCFKYAFHEARQENPRAILAGLDVAMRGCIKPNVLMFSVSAQTFYRMVSNMDDTFLSTYIWDGLKKRLKP